MLSSVPIVKEIKALSLVENELVDEVHYCNLCYTTAKIGFWLDRIQQKPCSITQSMHTYIEENRKLVERYE